MKQVMGRIATAVASLVLLGVAWLTLYELLSFGWRA
jgi:hypothetical protein